MDQDHHVAGAEALFDQALTNGLLAIVDVDWPGRTTNAKGWTLPASDLLKVLEEEVGLDGGVANVFTGAEGKELIPVDVGQLRAAVSRTQVTRHGRGPGQQVAREDVEALLAIDGHPALRALNDYYLDENWRSAQVEDRNEQARAVDYLELLDSDEIARRDEAASRELAPEPGDVGIPPQECLVCGHKTMKSTGSDSFGYGIVAGTCLICSYRRTSDIAYNLGMDIEWDLRWAHL